MKLQRTMNIIATLSVLATSSCDNSSDRFKSERVSRTASFIVDTDIESAFPLFGAFEERKWAPHWEPELIYPAEEVIEEGTTFKVSGHGHGGESEFLWIVNKYEPDKHRIQYLVSTDERFWTIDVICGSVPEEKTEVTVTYTYTGLSKTGNELNTKSLSAMFNDDLQDWADAINGYLSSVE